MEILSTSILSPEHSTNSANFLPRDFQEYHKTAPIFPRSTVLKKRTQGRKPGRKRIRKTFKFLCRLPVSAAGDKRQRLVRSGSSLFS